MKPFYAQFGAKDNAHKLLSSNLSDSLIPIELAGLTDRPPGDIDPKEMWWPSIGCGPIGEIWWGIWWSEPDEEATRPGMVKSSAFLWKLEDLYKVNNLLDYFSEIGAFPSDVEISNAQKTIALDFLIQNCGNSIITNLDYSNWVTLINEVWIKLPLTLKKHFSARTALTPPQSNLLNNLTWIFNVPSYRMPQWHNTFPKLDLSNNEQKKLHRGAEYLIHAYDPTLDDVIKQIPLEGQNLSALKKLSRIADSVDELKSKSSIDSATNLLRTLISIDRNCKKSDALEIYAATKLAENIKGSSITQIKKLGNLDIPINMATNIQIELEKYIGEIVLHDVTDNFLSLLDQLSSDKSKPWWQTSISNGIKRLESQSGNSHVKFLLKALAAPQIRKILLSIVDFSNEETQLLRECEEQKYLSRSEIIEVGEAAKEKSWPQISAWALLSTLPPLDALRKQASLEKESKKGLIYLIRKVSTEISIKYFLEGNITELVDEIAYKTINAPEYISLTDIDNNASRLLWSRHIALGGTTWPEKIDKHDCLTKIIKIAYSKQPTYGLIGQLSNDLAPLIFKLDNRADIWELLDLAEKATLLTSTATYGLNEMSSCSAIEEPELTLAIEIKNLIRNSVKTSSAIVTVIHWKTTSELEAIDFTNDLTDSNWKIHGASVGALVKSRGWKTCATRFYSQLDLKPNVKCALEHCYTLLSTWHQFKCRIKMFGLTTDDDYRHIADLASDLAPHDLDGIWERAGGKIKDLLPNASPANRWQHAVRIAKDGGLKEGMNGIVFELANLFPHNQDLKDIIRTLER